MPRKPDTPIFCMSARLVHQKGLDLILGADLLTDEEWEMTRGNVTVRATDAAVLVNDDNVRRTIAWGEEVHLLGYTAQALIDRVNANGSFSIEAWHPEAGRGAEGVSQFSVDEHGELPAVGRTMVVLRRT